MHWDDLPQSSAQFQPSSAIYFSVLVSLSCSLAVLAAFVLAAALSLRPLYPCGPPALMTLRSSRALSPHGLHILVGSQSLRWLSPHGFLVLVAASSSRLLRPHDLLVLVAASSSRLLRSHDFLVLTASSFSRTPRQIKGRHRLQPSRIAKTFPFSHLHRLSVSWKYAHPPFLVGQARKLQ